MSIWSTSIPTTQDYPIWAFTDDSNDVVLIKHPEEFSEPITWCKADIPAPPKSALRKKYEMLADSSVSEVWCSYNWFEAGYRYGKKQTEGTCGCEREQDKKLYKEFAKSPFVNPEDYWDEPNESAYDERP